VSVGPHRSSPCKCPTPGCLFEELLPVAAGERIGTLTSITPPPAASQDGRSGATKLRASAASITTLTASAGVLTTGWGGSVLTLILGSNLRLLPRRYRFSTCWLVPACLVLGVALVVRGT
jgi:hypothetical protein